MRDDRIRERWTEKVKSFMLAPYPVTAAEYAIHAIESSRKPVVNVSWFDAIHYCNRLSVQHGLTPSYSLHKEGEDVQWNREADGYRLPTEAEWQYACKAQSPGYRYGELDEIAWYRDNSDGRLHDAGLKRPNAWGLYDMLGNVWEWCWDLYDEEVYGSYRIFRGSSWAEEARGCGATCRRRSHPSFRIDDLGFRLARSVSSP